MTQQTTLPPFTDFMSGLMDGMARVARLPKVYPMYLASRIKAALKAPDEQMAPGQHIIEAVGDIETLGSAHYAMTATDHNGTKYRITVKIEEPVR